MVGRAILRPPHFHVAQELNGIHGLGQIMHYQLPCSAPPPRHPPPTTHEHCRPIVHTANPNGTMKKIGECMGQAHGGWTALSKIFEFLIHLQVSVHPTKVKIKWGIPDPVLFCSKVKPWSNFFKKNMKYSSSGYLRVSRLLRCCCFFGVFCHWGEKVALVYDTNMVIRICGEIAMSEIAPSII